MGTQISAGTCHIVALLLLSSLEQAASAQTRVIVQARRPYTDTSIFVSTGQTISVKATGKIYIGALKDRRLDYEPPSGHAWPSCARGTHVPFIAPGLACWSLLGKIGDGGPPFEIGAAATFIAHSSGEFYLGVNDNVFSDNAGSWTVDVTVGGAGVVRPGSTLAFSAVGATGATDGIQAGTVDLAWNVARATTCRLASTPSIPTLTAEVPCSASHFNVSLPINLFTSPVRYTFTLAAQSSEHTDLKASVAVYALPAMTFGEKGTEYKSLTHTAVLQPTREACLFAVPLCWFQFGLADTSAVDGTALSIGSSAAKGAGMAIAGVGGLNFALGGDLDTLTAEYGPYSSVPSRYSQYLAVQTQATVAHLQACATLEGAAGTTFALEVKDSESNEFTFPHDNDTCEHLIAGPGGETLQGVFEVAKQLISLGSDDAAIFHDYFTETKARLGTTIASDLVNLVSDLLNGPVAGGVAVPQIPIWNAVSRGDRPYKVSVTPFAAIASLGVGAGAIVVVVSHSTTFVNGVAIEQVPAATPESTEAAKAQDQPTGARPESKRQIASRVGIRLSVSASPAIVSPGEQTTISGFVQNAIGTPIAGAAVQLGVSIGQTTGAPVTVTSGRDGGFAARFTAPQTLGPVSFTATVVGISPAVTAKGTVQVVPPKGQ